MNCTTFSKYFLPILIAIISLCSSESVFGQVHPRLYLNGNQRAGFVKSLDQTKWKKDLVDRKKARLEKFLKFCEEDSSWLLSRLQMNWKTRHTNVYLVGGEFSHSDGEAPVPTVRYSGTRDWATEYLKPRLEDVEPYFDDKKGLYLQRKDDKEFEWVEPSLTGHIIENINEEIMRLVEDAAFLYWLTGNKKYAEFATPVYFQYIEGMYYRNAPEVLDGSNQAGLSGLATFEVIHEGIVVSLTSTYDFLFNYFVDQGKDLAHSTGVFQKWGDQIIEKGVPDNNWNLFQARFLTYIAMVLDDDDEYLNGKGRQYFLRNTFDISSERQIALKESILVYDQENGIWPESPSYSMHATTTLLEILTLLDQSTNVNELLNFPVIEKAALAAFQYLFPSGYTVGFGDSGHGIIAPKNFELLIANYRKYGQTKKEEMISGLLSEMIEGGLYSRQARGLFELFFHVDDIKKSNNDTELTRSLITPTFYAPNTSFFVQRIGEGDNAMMISTVGSFGNHAHANGIAIEVFANNYVLGPDMGRGSSYWHEDFLEYYSQMPAHNSVVVDGVSAYKSMRSYNPYTLENCFPKSESIPLFDKITYSMVSFLEPKTMANQQRLTTQIKTPSGQTYAVDIFRSAKIRDDKQRHDYFYHNIGQLLQTIDKNDQVVEWKKSSELGTIDGDQKGYDYFSDKKKVVFDDDFKAHFTISENDKPTNVMQLWVKGKSEQQVFGVIGPKSNSLSRGTAPKELIDTEIPGLILRREEAAWKDPFVVLYNPFLTHTENTIVEVDFDNNKYDGQRVAVSLTNGSQDVILAGSSTNSIYENEEVFQKGLLSISRWSRMSDLEFLFLSGITRYQTMGWEVVSEGEAVTVTLEKTESGFELFNDGPVLLRVPLVDNSKTVTIQFFENGQPVLRKDGIVTRNKEGQVGIRIEKAYEKAIISFK